MKARKFSNQPPIGYKTLLIGITIIYSFFVVIAFFDSSQLLIQVKPKNGSTYYESTAAKFNDNKVLLTGTLQINTPTIWERIILPQEDADFNFSKNLFLLASCLILLKILPKVKNNSLFSYDVSKQIITIGLLVVIYSFVEIIQNRIASSIISDKTMNQFMFNKNTNRLLLPTIWIGLIIIWLGNTYKKAFTLKQEQDLTI